MAKGRRQVKAARPVPALMVKPEDWPANMIEHWPFGRLQPHERNARTHSHAQIEQFCAAIAEDGITRPWVVDDDGTILAGHGMRLACRRLGISDEQQVPVIVARGWPEWKKRAFLLRDNKIADNAGWDKDLLGIELAALDGLPEVDLSLVGFSKGELARLLPKTERVGGMLAGEKSARPRPGSAVSRAGLVWLLGQHKLICGNGVEADFVVLDAVVKRWEGLAGKRAILASGELITEEGAAAQQAKAA